MTTRSTCSAGDQVVASPTTQSRLAAICSASARLRPSTSIDSVMSQTVTAAPGARFRLGRLDRDPASEGTGLGLTIAARLAEQAGARLVTDIVDGTATAALDWAPGRRD